MKNLLKTTTTTALIMLALVGCEKDYDEIVPQASSKIENAKKNSTTNKSEGSFDDNGIDVGSVGTLHNLYLQEAIDYALDNNTLNYAVILDQLDFGMDESEQDAMNAALLSSTENERMALLNSYVSSDIFNILMDLENVIETSQADYNYVNEGLNNVLDDVDFGGMDEFNTYLVKGYAETLRSSAYFWYPTSTGGSAAGDTYRSARGESPSDTGRLSGWARADGRGFGWGMAWGALSANPVGIAMGALGGAIGGSLMH